MKKEKKRKNNKRSQQKYPALVPSVNARVRQEVTDYDYLDQLTPAELNWLNRFTEEYVNASLELDDNNKIIPEENLHQTEQHKKQIYDANNARNRCLFGQIKGKVANTKLLNYEDVINLVEDEFSKEVNPMNMENAYAEYLDFKEVEEFLKEYDDAMSLFKDGE